MSIREGQLVLRDGSVFEGELIGAVSAGGVSSGEVVFHTGLTGYQEVISDPSYAGQIITFTTPHIGNYGTTPFDNEATKVHARGVIVREEARRFERGCAASRSPAARRRRPLFRGRRARSAYGGAGAGRGGLSVVRSPVLP